VYKSIDVKILGVYLSYFSIKCTEADVWLRTPDDGQKRLPETCRVVIPIKIGIQRICWFYSQGICYDAR
jgi:hypothetical protein